MEEMRTPGKRGMLQFRRDAVKLRFNNYLTSNLPSIPRQYGHVTNTLQLGMLGNDHYGCCVCAGAAHEIMIHNFATRKPVPRFTTANVVGQYMRLTGGQDTGLDPVMVARQRQQFGFTDADGGVHKIKGYALIDSLEGLGYAVYLYGVGAVGFYLPSTAEQQFGAGHPWDDLSHDPNPNAGHYVTIAGKNSQGLWVGMTWNNLQGITDQYIQKYSFSGGAGGLAYFSAEYLLSTGVSPEAINEVQLNADLLAI